MSKSTELTSFDFNYRRYREKDKDKLQPLTVHTCCLWSQAQLFKYWMQLNSRISGFLTFRVLFCYFFFFTWTKMFIFSIRWPNIVENMESKLEEPKTLKKRNPFLGFVWHTVDLFATPCSCKLFSHQYRGCGCGCGCVCRRLLLLLRSLYDFCNSIHVRALHPFVGCFRFKRKLSKLLWNL